MPTFQELLNDPDGGPLIQAAWDPIHTQLQLEGASGGDILAAKETFADTFSQLTTSTFGVNADDAVKYAADFTSKIKTAAGAVQTISTLVTAAQSAQTPQEAEAVINTVVGTIIAVGAAAGAVSAGVGALISAAVAVTFAIIEAAGLTGKEPVAQQCGIGLSFTPSIAIGCAGSSNAPKNQVNAPGWRHFPDPKSPWFTVHTAAEFNPDYPVFHWTDSQWYAMLQVEGPSYGVPSLNRAIDAAFPQYKTLEAGTNRPLPANVPAILKNFRDAYFLAWKGNAAWAFNGLVPQDDVTVLVQTAAIWNQAHSNSSTYDVNPGDLWAASYSAVTDLVHSSGSAGSDTVVVGRLRLNTGPIKQPPVTPATVKSITLKLPSRNGPVAVSNPTSNPSGSSTARDVIIVTGIVAAAGALGVAAWSLLTHQSIESTVKGLWRSTGGRLVAKVNPIGSEAPKKRAPTTIQTLIFPRPKFSESRAKAWAVAHGYLAYKTDITAHSIRIRQKPPSYFKSGSLRTIELGHSGIKAVVGHLK